MSTSGKIAIRSFHTGANSSEIRDLLQAIFAGELISPSRCMWIVSPWISDIPILNNEAGSFSQLVPEWPRGRITLSRVLAQLLDSGSTVHIATRGKDINRSFLAALRHMQGNVRLRIHEQDELHEKGILADGFYLSGSMNFTFSGIEINEEVLHFIVDPSEVARNRVILTSRWGGEGK